MRVHVSIIAREALGGFAGSSVEVEEGVTLRHAVEACLEQAGIAVPEHLFEGIICMRNNKNALWDQPAADGDEILVLHKIMGG